MYKEHHCYLDFSFCKFQFFNSCFCIYKINLLVKRVRVVPVKVMPSWEKEEGDPIQHFWLWGGVRPKVIFTSSICLSIFFHYLNSGHGIILPFFRRISSNIMKIVSWVDRRVANNWVISASGRKLSVLLRFYLLQLSRWRHLHRVR